MKTQSLLIKTFMFFLIVLFHSALTRNLSAFIDHPDDSPNRRQTLHLGFDGQLNDQVLANGKTRFSKGLVQESLNIGAEGAAVSATINTGSNFAFDRDHDFTVEFWLRTTADSNDRFVVLSKKAMVDNSLRSHKQKGWAFCVANGTWAWNIGSGGRRLTYERDNGQYMQINDGRWHHLVMAYDHSTSLVRLYFDGINWTTYNLADKDGFDFSNEEPLTIGWAGEVTTAPSILPSIQEGAENLQQLVDRFNQLGLGDLEPNELMNLVIGSDRLIRSRLKEQPDPSRELPKEDLDAIKQLTRRLSRNPYTVHQVADFMKVAPLLKLYRLVDGQIEINQQKADEFAANERFVRAPFDIDELSIRQECVSSEEVMDRYSKHFRPVIASQQKQLKSLTAASFNIHHGGKHETIEEDGWDSRELIAEIIRREDIDIVMMQETYSSGDFIAAELGYYFATTVDWDYLNQGANISVLSRYPIEEITIPPNSPFMNVAARVVLSDEQEIFAMSNWYGMNNFEDVFQFHESRFSKSDNIPILFAGDFNAVPHTDGGNSPASKKLLASGFRDAYREQFPDVEKHPGASHESGGRIDQLYYKGKGLSNRSTQVLSTWPSRFPSDHFLIKTIFDLDYRTSPKD